MFLLRKLHHLNMLQTLKSAEEKVVCFLNLDILHSERVLTNAHPV